MKYVAPLRDDEIQTLHDMHRYHPARRARMRAHSLLLSHQGFSIPHIARFYQVDRRSVSTWLDRWQTMGVVGLYDQPGSGRPPLLNDEEQQKVHAYLRQYPKDVKKSRTGVGARDDETRQYQNHQKVHKKKSLCLETDSQITRQIT